MKVKYGNTADFIFKSAAEFLGSKEAVPMEVYKELEKKSEARAFSVSFSGNLWMQWKTVRPMIHSLKT